MSLPGEISRLVVELGAGAFTRICNRLESELPGATTACVIADLEDELSPWAAEALSRIAERETRPDVLASLLRSAAATAELVRAQLGESHLVWSGPDGGLASVRSLEQVLRDLILGAERELLLVSFAAYRVPHLLNALREVAERGVQLRFLLETAINSAGALSVDARAAFPAELLSTSRIYSWPLRTRPRNSAGHPAKLHAKFAVADRRRALISSANLTGDALERNVEAGVFISGGSLPGLLTDHIAQLIQRGIYVLEG